MLEKYKDNLLVKTINKIHEDRNFSTGKILELLYEFIDTNSCWEFRFRGEILTKVNYSTSKESFEDFTIKCISLLLLFKQDNIVQIGKELRGI